MAKKDDTVKKDEVFAAKTPPPDMPDDVGAIDRLPVVIHAQYIRDLSFENPNAPMPLKKAEGEPNISIEFGMDARKVEVDGFSNSYEVVLNVTAKATKGEMVTFIVEIEYGMMVTVDDVPEDKIHPLLLIEMPNYMFPYVRQIVSDVTQKAGYMPLLLAPVNFKALYRKRFGGPSVQQHERGANKQKETENA